MTIASDATVLALEGASPRLDAGSFVASGARVIGAVTLAEGASVWYNAVLRADSDSISLGAGSNIQDNVSVHVDAGHPVMIGENVSVGHNAVVHGCTIGDGSLIGMGSVILSGAVIGEGCLIAGGAVVLEGSVIPPGSLVAGVPGKVRRELSDEERAGILRNAEIYRAHTARHIAATRVTVVRPVALITGVGRPQGIGAGIARSLAARRLGSRAEPVAAGRRGDLRDGCRGGARRRDRRGPLPRRAGGRHPRRSASSRRPRHRSSPPPANELGTVEALVLSHAWDVESGILDTTVEEFDRHFAVNTRASWLLIAEFARQADRGGAIVALTSDHTTGNLPYGASKGALDRIVISAARELAPRGISANALNPGPIDTGWMDDDVRARAHRNAAGRAPRAGPPTSRRSWPSWCRPRGRWVTGQLLTADGGFSISI